MKEAQQLKFWSNLFFLIPFALATSYKVWWYSVVIGAVFIISTTFHFYREKKFVFIDVISSTTLMASNFILLFSGHWILPYSLTAVVFAIIALFFYFRQSKRNYNLNHGLWHIFSAGVSFFCLATLLNFMNLF
jgi:hypothetical protein